MVSAEVRLDDRSDQAAEFEEFRTYRFSHCRRYRPTDSYAAGGVASSLSHRAANRYQTMNCAVF